LIAKSEQHRDEPGKNPDDDRATKIMWFSPRRIRRMNDRLAVLMVVHHRMFLTYQNPTDAAKFAFLWYSSQRQFIPDPLRP
jgi:hypothetical protein